MPRRLTRKSRSWRYYGKWRRSVSDDVCGKVGISQATYYLWKRKYTGVGVSELRELRQLREEVGRLGAVGGGRLRELGPADPAGDRIKKL